MLGSRVVVSPSLEHLLDLDKVCLALVVCIPSGGNLSPPSGTTPPTSRSEAVEVPKEVDSAGGPAGGTGTVGGEGAREGGATSRVQCFAGLNSRFPLIG